MAISNTGLMYPPCSGLKSRGPSHLGKLPAARPDLHRVDPRCTGKDPAAVRVVHLLIGRDIEPVRPEPDAPGDVGSPPQVRQPQGREVVIDNVDDQVFIAFLRVQVQFVEDRVAPHLLPGKRRICRERFKAAGFPRYRPVTCATELDMILVSMPVLPEAFMFSPQFFELLDNLVVPADLLVDDKEHRVDRQHRSQDNSQQFSFHTNPPKKDEK